MLVIIVQNLADLHAVFQLRLRYLEVLDINGDYCSDLVQVIINLGALDKDLLPRSRISLGIQFAE